MKIRKILSFVLLVAVLSNLCVPAFAAEVEETPVVGEVNSVTVNEYDVYVQMRSTPADQLLQEGVSQQTIDWVKSDAIEKELTRLSSYSPSDLISLGYTVEQIELLRSYSGEAIENNPALRGIFADLTATPYLTYASTSTLTVMFMWTWSNPPAIRGTAFDDIVGVVWEGTNIQGLDLNLSLDQAESSCAISYYSVSDDTFQQTRTVSLGTDAPYGHVYGKFTLGDEYAAVNYAKTGTIIVTVNRTGTEPINECAFVFGYGHTILNISPSLSLSGDFGIGFSTGVEKMCEKAIIATSDWTLEEYYPDSGE